MTVVYLIGRFITFFGAFLKAFWEHLTCRILKLPVEDASYFQFNEMAGHIDHDPAPTRMKSFLMCFLPTLANSLISYPLVAMGYAGLFYIGLTYASSPFLFILCLVFIILGMSIWANTSPHIEDSLHLWEMIYKKNNTNIIVKILLFFPSIIFIIGSYVERYSIYLLFFASMIVTGILF